MSLKRRATKGEESRDKILDHALRLFSENGFAKTSTQEIADCCEISQTTVFYHFKNKRVLFEKVLERVITKNHSYFTSHKKESIDSVEELTLLLNSNIDWAQAHPQDAKVLLMLFNFSSSDDNFKVLATNTINNGRSLVLSSLKKIDESLGIKSKINLISLSIIIQQYINAVMFQMLARTDANEVVNEFREGLPIYLNILLGLDRE